jgi:hypothetical protein
VLDGTTYAPAYNASIPASSLGLNVSNLEQDIKLDRYLHTVFAELFIYNFLAFPGQSQERAPVNFAEFSANSLTLFDGARTLWDSLATLSQNVVIRKQTPEIAPGGFYRYPPGHIAKPSFDQFPQAIWQYHPKGTGRLTLSEAAFYSFHDLIAVARAHNIELSFWRPQITPTSTITSRLRMPGRWSKSGCGVSAAMRRCTVFRNRMGGSMSRCSRL